MDSIQPSYSAGSPGSSKNLNTFGGLHWHMKFVADRQN